MKQYLVERTGVKVDDKFYYKTALHISEKDNYGRYLSVKELDSYLTPMSINKFSNYPTGTKHLGYEVVELETDDSAVLWFKFKYGE
jgi:hypothetical protein